MREEASAPTILDPVYLTDQTDDVTESDPITVASEKLVDVELPLQATTERLEEKPLDASESSVEDIKGSVLFPITARESDQV